MDKERRNDRRIPEQFRSLFWEASIDELDIGERPDYIIERVLEYGTWEGIRWLRDTYGDDRIRDYLVRRGYKVLTRKTIAYWSFLLGLEHVECLQPSSLNNSRKLWDY